MTISLDDLMIQHFESLVDEITKDAIRRIPSYGKTPLNLTVERVERWLKTVAESVGQNDPEILKQHLTTVAKERREEGYAIGELHAIVQITEGHVQDVILDSDLDPTERTGHLALLDIVMEAARMVLSVTYLLSAHYRSSQRNESKDEKTS
jgi:hypothetical protein